MGTADTIKDTLKSIRPIVRERFASGDPVERQWAIDFIGELLEERLDVAGVRETRFDQPLLLQ